MNKIILQLWEESERGWGTRPDGCSIHIDLNSQKQYIKDYYKDRDDNVPDVYERIIGEPIEAFIDDKLFSVIEKDKNVRLFETELNNLLSMEEIIINHD
jgi:hypothetical protein